MKKLLPVLGLAVGIPAAVASPIVEAPTSILGTDFLIDEAATGSGDLNSSGSPEALNLDRDLGPFTPGSGGIDINIPGIAFGMPSGGNTNGNVITATITYLGADGSEGGGDDIELGSVSDSLDFTTGAGVYSWLFDTPLSANIDGANSQFRIRLESDPALNGGNSNNIRLKTLGGTAGAKLSVAGTAVPNNPGGGGGDSIVYSGYVIGSASLTPNGETLFSDRAAVGGNDSATFATGNVGFALQYSGLWNVGAEVNITGMALPLRTPTSAGTLSFEFYDSGSDETFGGIGSETLVGTATGTLQADLAAADAYYVNFATPVEFTSLGTGVVVHVTSDASIRFKQTTETGASAGTGAQALRVNATTGAGISTDPVMKTSLAGTAAGGTPALIQTASTSGFWDAITWSTTGGGSVSGDLAETDTVDIGSYHEVTYQGSPVDEVVKAIELGENASSGQGTLRISGGTLSTTGKLHAGLGAGANDSFVHVDGGSLNVGGNAVFGRFSDGVDGSLIVSGGSVSIGGNLELGGFLEGGAMLRFHNPGSSPPINVGGSLVLGRCALDLTFDAGYTHTPGQTITLVEYASRDGQFANFRRNDEFNCGPNRFRISYDVSSSGKLAIQLTALPNWTTESTPPNIVFVFTDDQGYSDLSINGHPDFASKYPMPALDSIVSSGVRFTDAYVTAGVCHPSRCGILSGIHQQRFGTDNNLGGSEPSYSGLPSSQRTVPRRLQGLGYRTYGVGKWHLGKTVEHHPNVRGFDHWYGMWGGSRSFYDAPDEIRVFQDQMTPDFASEDTDYLTDRIGDATVDFIDQHVANHPGEPFYLYMSFTAVHAPMDIKALDPRFARLQSEFGLTSADYEDPPIIFANRTEAQVEQNRYNLAAMTLALDENIAKVVNRVDELGITNNTIFVYMTDNGGAGWSQGFGGNYSYNYPLRGYKGGSMTDGSIRVPCAMNWPGTIPGGQVISEPVSALDFLASFVNAGGAPAQARNGLEGLDLLPLLVDGEPLPEDRVLTFRAGGVSGGGSAIRMGDWKLLINDPGGTETLYHLPTDSDENSNQIGTPTGAETAAELRRRFDAWEASTLPPLYGSSSTELDGGLERHAITGGLRLRRDEASLAWLSAPFRDERPLNDPFHFSFLARSTEAAVGSDGELAYGLGDSSNRSQFIRAVVDYGGSQIRIEDGRSGNSDSAAVAVVPDEFTEGKLSFDPTTKQMSFKFAGASVALTLDGGHGPISHYAFGAAGMEGELSTLIPTKGDGLSGARLEHSDRIGGDLFEMIHRFVGQPPFPPTAESTDDLSDFSDESTALVESLGGGVFRTTAPTAGHPDRKFYRLRLGGP